MWHELGHVRFKNDSTIDQQSSATNRHPMFDPTFKKIALQVSRYAAVNGQEFIAEVFAGQRAGRKFGDDVLQYYQRLGGPKL